MEEDSTFLSFASACNAGYCLRDSKYYFISSTIGKLSGEQSGAIWRTRLGGVAGRLTDRKDPSHFPATPDLKGALGWQSRIMEEKCKEGRQREEGALELCLTVRIRYL